MHKRNSVCLCVLLSFLALSVSCVTQDHTLTISRPETEKPVSASAAFIDASGTHIQPEDYTVIDHFSFEKRVSAPVVGETRTEVDIYPELEGVITDDEADAVVNLQLYAKEHDNGNIRLITALNVAGWYLTGIGVPLVLGGLADGYEENYYMVDMFSIFSLVGGASLTASYIMMDRNESTWHIGFEGDTVRLSE
jgi:hypothetical protein